MPADNVKKTSQLSAACADMESVLAALDKQSIAAIYVIQNNCFSYVNQAFAHIFAYDSPVEIIENFLPIDLVAAESRDMVENYIQQQINGAEDSYHYFFTGVRKDGEKVELEVHGNRAMYQGKPAVVGVLLDVTNRVRMETGIINRGQQLQELVETGTAELNKALNELKESDQRYRVLFDGSKVPMLMIDSEAGTIVDANEAACTYYGYTYKELISLRISDINQLSPEEIVSEMHKARAQKRDHFFFIHKLADGSLRHVEVHSGPLDMAGKKLLYSIIHDITDRRAAEAQLKELNLDFITLLENTTDFVYFKDRESRFRFCSQTLADITGHSSWKEMVGKHDLEVFPPDTARIYMEEEYPVFQNGEPLLNKTDPYYREDGERGWVNTNKWPVFDESGDEVIGLFGISRDVTLQHKNEQELIIAASVFNNASEGILISDEENKIVAVNEAFCRISGYSQQEVINQSPGFLKSGHHDKAFFKAMWDSLEESSYWQGEIWNRHKDGSLFACRTSINVIRDETGKVSRYIGLHSDITDFLKHHEEVEHMAYYDALTELPNRVLLNDRMVQALAMSDRTNTSVAVCFLDLDTFKPVNDQFGHKAGDLLLIEIAKRLKDSVRVEDTVARLGGDEFAMIVTQLTNEHDLLLLIKRILASITDPFMVPQGEMVRVSASIGICLYPQYNGTGAQLLRYADQAMYEAKEMGRNRYRFYGGVAKFRAEHQSSAKNK